MAIKQTKFTPIKTKLSPPNITSDQLVIRKQLQIENYHDWLHKVANVVTPAGYGKSMLLWQWYQQVPSNISRAWLNIDKQDNDSLRLMRYIASACQQGYQQELKAIQSLLASTENVPTDYLLDALLGEIEQKEQPLLLFIDDIHLISKRKSLNLLKQFIHRAPPYVGIIIAGRTRLRAGLSQLKVSGRLVEFDVENLNFSQVEISQFFTSINDKPLTKKQLHIIQVKTEGWVAGMQLIALATQEQAIEKVLSNLSGSFSDIADYLGELVFRGQLPELQNFLLKSSVLDRFNMNLCKAVIGEEIDVQHQLTTIKDKQLFLITLDSNNEWYRYHHLFQDFLRQQLRQNNIKEYQNCLMKTSEWCEQESMIHEAIDYAFKGRLYDRAAYLLSEYGLEIWIYQFNYEEFQSWLAQIPKHYFEKWPLISICAAHHELAMANYKEADQYIKLVDQWLLENDLGHSKIDIIQKVVTARDATNMLAISIYKDNQILVSKYEQWRKKYPTLDDYYLGPVYASLASRYQANYQYKQAKEMAMLASTIAANMGVYFGVVVVKIILIHLELKQNNMVQARYIIEKTMRELDEKNLLYLKKLLYPMLLYIHWEQGDLKRVEHYLRFLSIKSIEKLHVSLLTTTAYLIASKFEWLNRNDQQAQDLLSKAQKKVSEPGLLFRILVEYNRQLFFKNDIARMLELYALAQAKRTTFRFMSDVVDISIKEMLQVMQIRILIAQDKLQSALELLMTLLRQFNKQGRYAEVIRLLVMKAHVLHEINDDKAALVALKKALMLAIPNEITMLFIEEGYAIKKLIRESLLQLSNSVSGLLPSGYSQKIISLLNEQSKQVEKGTTKQTFYETLTPREENILQHLDSLLTREQLAAKLEISVSTLKWHLINLYQKLQVKNRHAAVIQAKKFGLLSNN